MMSDAKITPVIIDGEAVILVPVPPDFPQQCAGNGHVFWEPHRCACGRFWGVEPPYRQLPVAFGFTLRPTEPTNE